MIRIKYRKKVQSDHADLDFLSGQLARIDAQVIPFKVNYLRSNETDWFFKVNPNPNNGNFIISYHIQNQGNYSIILYSISGAEFILLPANRNDIEPISNKNQ